MKYLGMLLVAMVICGIIWFGSSQSQSADSSGETLPNDAAGSAALTQEVAFEVSGMFCAESCAVNVKDILAQQNGVQEVTVDFPSKTAHLTVQSEQFDQQSAVAALEDQDFIAKLVESSATSTN